MVHRSMLLKSPEYHKAYELWKFIDSYEKLGITYSVKETNQEFDDAYYRQIYGLVMIAIIGVTQDDVLYFKTKMTLEEQGTLFGDILYYKGSLSKQAVVVVAVGESCYLSTIATSMIIARFEPYLIFNIGSVSAISAQLKQGDIFIPDRYYFDQVDFTSNLLGEYGQIPGHGAFIVADGDLNSTVESTSYLLTNRYVQRGYMMASNYLAQSAEGHKDALKSSFYTGAAYIFTVALLVLPYLLFSDGMKERD